MYLSLPCTSTFSLRRHIECGQSFSQTRPFLVWSQWVYMVVYERCPVIAFSRRSFDLSGQIWVRFFFVCSVDDRYLSEM